MDTDDNPYASPKVNCDRDILTLPVLPRDRWNEVEVQADVTRDFWKRRIALNGSINTVIDYDPVGAGERVYVDGHLLVTTSGHGWRLVQPHIDFVVEAFGHVVLASIDVKASLFFFKTYAFRLQVAGKTVYDESAKRIGAESNEHY